MLVLKWNELKYLQVFQKKAPNNILIPQVFVVRIENFAAGIEKDLVVQK